jgi:hypothetical protein
MREAREKTMKNRLFTTLALGALFAITLPAQEAAQRKVDQQARIGQGVKSGQLRAGEANRLENKEHRINNETKADRAANGGHLSAGDKATVNHQQNKVSRDIYRDKHNAKTQ